MGEYMDGEKGVFLRLLEGVANSKKASNLFCVKKVAHAYARFGGLCSYRIEANGEFSQETVEVYFVRCEAICC